MRAQQIADYFLAKTDTDQEIVFTNMKLQKFLYYVQGYHLAMHREPLFDEAIEAWDHGPVVYNIWHEYKDQGNDILPQVPDSALSDFDEYIITLLDNVFDELKGLSAWALREQTHGEQPWQQYYEVGAHRKVIPNDVLMDFFEPVVKVPTDETLAAIKNVNEGKNLTTFDSLADFEAGLNF